MFYNERIDAAIRFAATRHHGQMRKVDPEVPYIFHPIMVGLMLRDAGFSDDVVIAGILHDTVEDTPTTVEEVQNTFGANVADLVCAVTEDKTVPVANRKTECLERVLVASQDAKALKVVDTLHNTQTLLRHLAQGDTRFWQVFHQTPQEMITRYRQIVIRIGETWSHPLLTELDEAVRKLESAVEHAPEPRKGVTGMRRHEVQKPRQ